MTELTEIETDPTLSCGYKGVVQHGKRYYAQIYLHHKQRQLGPFADVIDAARCYDYALMCFSKNFQRKPTYAKFNWPETVESESVNTEYVEKCEDLRTWIEREELRGQKLPEYAPKEEAGKQRQKILSIQGRLDEVAKSLGCVEELSKKFDVFESFLLKASTEHHNLTLGRLDSFEKAMRDTLQHLGDEILAIKRQVTPMQEAVSPETEAALARLATRNLPEPEDDATPSQEPASHSVPPAPSTSALHPMSGITSPLSLKTLSILPPGNTK